MLVKLLRRIGQHPKGREVDYDTTTAHSLINRGIATPVERPVDDSEGDNDNPNVEPESGAELDGQADDTDDVDDDSPVDDDSEGDNDQADGDTLAGLKAKADELKLPTYGTKAQLRERIEAHLSTTN